MARKCSFLQGPNYRPQGALVQEDGSVVWRVWAPFSESVALVTFLLTSQGSEVVRQESVMQAEEYGFFSHRRTDVPEGMLYKYLLSDGREYPDPASRWQPHGVHEPSAVLYPGEFRWHDEDWHGVVLENLVIYELHVGTFTPEGTFEAIIPRLTDLADLGITALELMPISQFPGDRGWGYDGVHPFAAQNSYGGPHGLQRLIDAAHQAGLAMILDMVYNHFGPEGCYFGDFGPYFNDHYHTPWGSSINYDGSDSEPVRRFVLESAVQWVCDFHFDGLRLDAIQNIYDRGPLPIVAEIQAEVQAAVEGLSRHVQVIAETNENDFRHLLPISKGGYGLSGVWSDDFHHSLHSLLTGERYGYYEDYGQPEHLMKAYNDVFVYDGCYSHFHRHRRGSRVDRVDRAHFIESIQNHDQIGNRAVGDRLGTLIPQEAQRLACALLMISPCVPLLFMGEEYGETRPFPFFCSFLDISLAELVRRGRRREFAEMAFKWNVEVPDPQAVSTFESAKISWSWPAESHHAHLRKLYHDLLVARREWPALRDRRHTRARLLRGKDANESASDSRTELLILERGKKGNLLTAVANPTPHELLLPELSFVDRPLKLSTEVACYGGVRRGDRESDMIFPYEMMIFY